MPKGIDARIDERTMQLLKPQMLSVKTRPTIHASPVCISRKRLEASPAQVDENGLSPLKELWNRAAQNDDVYERAVDTIHQEKRTFPHDLGLKVSTGECSLDAQGHLRFRGRLWVPGLEELRTKMMQETHDSKACGHPGRDNTCQILERQYFWSGMSQDVRRFVQNCDACGRNKVWRDKRQEFLKPLPVPDQIWKEISIDFITQLPESKGCTNLVVITDRLSKGIMCEGLSDIKAETVAQ